MAQYIGLARLGRDAEVRYTPNGDAVANLSLAFSYGKKGEDGFKPTNWVDGALWGKRAEALAPYLLKGQLVVATIDDLHIETFDKRDGDQGTKLSGTVSYIDFAGSPKQSGGEGGVPSQRPTTQAQRPAAPAQSPAQRPAATAQRPAATGKASSAAAFDDMDDDIPF